MKDRFTTRTHWLAFAIGSGSVALQLALLFVLGHSDMAQARGARQAQCAEAPVQDNGAAIMLRAMEVSL